MLTFNIMDDLITHKDETGEYYYRIDYEPKYYHWGSMGYERVVTRVYIDRTEEESRIHHGLM